jgi:hypothetical protein
MQGGRDVVQERGDSVDVRVGAEMRGVRRGVAVNGRRHLLMTKAAACSTHTLKSESVVDCASRRSARRLMTARTLLLLHALCNALHACSASATVAAWLSSSVATRSSS